MKTARDFIAVGTAMSQSTYSNDETSDAIRAVSLLVQMGGELAAAAGRLLSEGEHYAGAALVRQVEIEYLTWTFKEGHRSASKWLRSTQEERREMFAPVQLRKTLKGRFLDKDFRDHCEQGGHPVPKGSLLLDGGSAGSAQVLLVDLMCHCWRTWDQVVRWSTEIPDASMAVLDAGNEISARIQSTR